MRFVLSDSSLTVAGHQDERRKELESLRGDVLKLTSEELDRDLAELNHEIQFLEEQMRVDIGSYPPAELERANAKIVHFKQKAEILKMEISSRKSKLD